MSRRVKCWILMAVVLGASGICWGQKKAGVIMPADGATDVIFAIFSWTPGSTALFHNLYLGVTPDLGPEQLIAKEPVCDGHNVVPPAGRRAGDDLLLAGR